MGIISISPPVVGQTNATEDAKIPSALTTIETVINGNIDTNNLSPTAGIVAGQLAAAAASLVPTLPAGSAGIAVGHMAVAVGGATITLPTPVVGAEVAIVAASTVTGASPVTVTRGGSSLIFGAGLAAGGATSFLLGSGASFARLQSYDGTNWVIVSGQQDSGWVALTLAANVATVGGYTPAAQILGNRVWFSGGMVNTGSFSAGVTWATLPSSAFRPASTSYLNALSVGSPGVTVDATNSTSALVQVGGPATNGTILTLEGTSYRLS